MFRIKPFVLDEVSSVDDDFSNSTDDVPIIKQSLDELPENVSSGNGNQTSKLFPYGMKGTFLEIFYQKGVPFLVVQLLTIFFIASRDLVVPPFSSQ